MTTPNIKIEDTEKGEEKIIEVPVPDPVAPDPKMLITTKKRRLRRMPLGWGTETHGMTTDTGRFKEV